MLPQLSRFGMNVAIFRASVISNSLRVAESGRNSAFYNRCAIDLPSSVPWHGVDQFLASKIYPIGFKQPDWRYSSRPILSFQHRAIAASETGAGQLDARDRALNVATVGLLIAVTLSTAIALLSAGYGLPALPPAQRAVAQRLSALGHLSAGQISRARFETLLQLRLDKVR